ncbi:MAG: rod shape-determining protein MreC [Novosphingobium sp.]
MPPQSDRRPGFSRRAQYGIFTGYVVAVLGALAGLALLVVALLRPGSFAGLRAGAGEISAPVGAVTASTRHAGNGLYASIAGYVRAGAQNAELRREVEAGRVAAVRMQAVAQENRRLKALLGLIDREGRPVAVARLIGSSAGSTRRFATLAAGRRQGVRAPMPVRSAKGLIGRVLEVGPDTSRVLLITDGENVVPVRRARDDVAAFSTGRADGRLVIKLLNMGINPLKRGDVFVTSGSGGVYRPGIPVAVVETLTRDGAIARLVEDPAAAEFVLVDRVFEAAEPPPATVGVAAP